MKTRAAPEVIYRRGRPVAVILDIETYEQLLTRLEDQEDIEELRQLRAEPQDFRSLDAFLTELDTDV